MGFLLHVLCSIFVLMFQFVAGQVTDPVEVTALISIARYWNLKTWNFTALDPCTQNAPWASSDANPGISCDCSFSSNTCHVTHMRIYAIDISGEIPQELFQLTELIDLNLGQNVLSGPISAKIGQLSKMKYLSLGINNLSGQVPVELGNLSQLISLSFSSNKLSGSLPKELGKLTSLEQLYIDSSGVSGEIPQEVENLKSLQTIWASDNLFTGSLPDFIGTFTNLKDLRIEGTLLEGPIPTSFSALSKLQILRIGELTKADSSLSFLKSLTSLSILTLRNSQVSGQVPEWLGDLSNLKYLDLSFNRLTGQIPSSFQNFKSLEFLFLGSNGLIGELPAQIITPNLIALDVSFTSISGNLPLNYDKAGLYMNFVGTSIQAGRLYDRKDLGMLHCLQEDSSCTDEAPTYSSFSVNCGGPELTSAAGIDFNDDSEILGAASFYTSTQHQWAVSNTGTFLFNSGGPQYMAKTDSQITGTLESELYKTSRISPSSLRYYSTGLKNGKYNVELHFAEIYMDESESWKGLGRRLFDIYIQAERALKDFDIQAEANGSNSAVVRTFEANVTDTVLDIHFFWAGRGTCCIPRQGTYGPLVSAIHVSQVSSGVDSKSDNGKRSIGEIVGIAIGCAAGLLIISSVFYLWWAKKNEPGHIRVHTESPRKE